jgi:signal peptidase II
MRAVCGCGERVKRNLRWFALAVVVFILDQLSKTWVLKHFDALNLCGFAKARLSPCDQAIMPFINFTMLWNPGVSMSLFPADGAVTRWLITALTVGISLFVLWALVRERDRWQALAYALILGGAVGNIVDRLRFGAVVDYIRFNLEPLGSTWSFFVFNVADAGISIGVVLLVVRALFPGSAHTSNEKA